MHIINNCIVNVAYLVFEARNSINLESIQPYLNTLHANKQEGLDTMEYSYVLLTRLSHSL